MLKTAFGNERLSRASRFEWFESFKKGAEAQTFMIRYPGEGQQAEIIIVWYVCVNQFLQVNNKQCVNFLQRLAYFAVGAKSF